MRSCREWICWTYPTDRLSHKHSDVSLSLWPAGQNCTRWSLAHATALKSHPGGSHNRGAHNLFTRDAGGRARGGAWRAAGCGGYCAAHQGGSALGTRTLHPTQQHAAGACGTSTRQGGHAGSMARPHHQEAGCGRRLASQWALLMVILNCFDRQLLEKKMSFTLYSIYILFNSNKFHKFWMSYTCRIS